MEHPEDFIDVLLLPLPGVTDDVPVSRRADTTADSQHPVHGRPKMPSAVPAEHELVQVGVEMLLPEAVECAKRPSLHVREDDVNPFEAYMGGNLRLREIHLGERTTRNAVVSGVLIGPQVRSGLGVRQHEWDEACGRAVGNACQPDAADCELAAPFDRSGDPNLIGRAAAATALQVILFPSIRNGGLVHVDVARKWRSIRIDHGPAQLVEQEPSRLVGHAQLGLELKGGDAVRVSGNQVRR